MRATTGAPGPGTGTGHDDEDAGFVAIYERELPQQVRHAALMIGSPEAAHDLVHDALVEVFRRRAGCATPLVQPAPDVENVCIGFGSAMGCTDDRPT